MKKNLDIIAKSMKMNKLFIILLLTISVSSAIFAQEKNYLKHTVLKGETISQIATKYKVTPFDIYRLNPDYQAGIKENDIVLIPISEIKSTAVVPNVVKPKPTSVKNHTTKPKENLYSIARDYNVDVNDLKALNADVLKEGLKIGQVIKIPSTTISNSDEPTKIESKPVVVETKSKVETNNEKVNFHIVEPKETKFGIAKKYGMTVEELEAKNPEIVSNLTVGYKLIIAGIVPKKEIEKPVVEKPKPVVYEITAPKTTETEVVKTIKKTGFANYEVKPKETLYSLSQAFGISQEELINLNPSLKEGVKEGMILKVPGKGSITKVITSTGVFSDLSKSIQTSTKKQLALLIPFNASKIQADTLKTIDVRLKKDAFLNMTLDFYSGALMAIDSAKTLGLNIDVKILDSEESKLSSNVVNLVNENHLENADAVVGPFYQQYVEKVADLLSTNNVPVISPLSKEIGKSYSNLFQAMPPSDFAKSAMFDYMLSKNGNIIIVSDPKKVSNREFITKKYPSAQFVAFTEKGALDLENLKTLLVKDKLNYVVLDTEKTGMILGTTNKLLNELSNFQIQLVIIEPNETLDFEEISMKRLTILKMLYPSLNRENNSPEATIFENKYKSINKVFPSQYAVRGFDVTFDTMLRLSQGKTFENTANDSKTEQVESKFEYAKKDTGGYLNKGVYIMQYNEDLSVTQVN